MATYDEIRKFVKDKHGITAQNCWIAHVKEIHGLRKRIAHNRDLSKSRKKPCPEDKVEWLEEAFRHFGMIK